MKAGESPHDAKEGSVPSPGKSLLASLGASSAGRPVSRSGAAACQASSTYSFWWVGQYMSSCRRAGQGASVGRRRSGLQAKGAASVALQTQPCSRRSPEQRPSCCTPSARTPETTWLCMPEGSTSQTRATRCAPRLRESPRLRTSSRSRPDTRECSPTPQPWVPQCPACGARTWRLALAQASAGKR